jgi:alkylation response protein AidB-like acyl-CoA dehydrogenase
LKKAWELGLLNHHIPSKFGGSELSALDGAIVSEEMAYGCTGIWTAAEANNLAVISIYYYEIMICTWFIGSSRYLGWK